MNERIVTYANLLFLVFLMTLSIYRDWKRSLLKLSAYDYLPSLDRDEWKFIDQIRQDVENRIDGLLFEGDVLQAMQILEEAGLDSHRFYPRERIRLFIHGLSLPDNQFKLHSDYCQSELAPVAKCPMISH